jgi:hypothetical protein
LIDHFIFNNYIPPSAVKLKEVKGGLRVVKTSLKCQLLLLKNKLIKIYPLLVKEVKAGLKEVRIRLKWHNH